MKKHFTYLLSAWAITLLCIAFLLYISLTTYSDSRFIEEESIIPFSLTALIIGGSLGLLFAVLSSHSFLITEYSRIKKNLILLFLVFPVIFISCTLLYASFLFLTGM